MGELTRGAGVKDQQGGQREVTQREHLPAMSKDIVELEKVKKRAVKTIKGLQFLFYEEASHLELFAQIAGEV